MIRINIAKDFTETPGPRYKKDGEFSGQEFRELLLVPKFEEAIAQSTQLEINLDGGYGYPSSFLEEAFGGLSRIYGEQIVLSTLRFVSLEEPLLVNAIEDYIRKAKL